MVHYKVMRQRFAAKQERGRYTSIYEMRRTGVGRKYY